jgi:hypothetical protein
MYSIYTFFELYDLLNQNNIQIKGAVISRDSMIELLSSKILVDTHQISEHPVWIPTPIGYGVYAISVLQPSKFEIFEGDAIVMPDNKEYIITDIYCKSSEVEDEMRNVWMVKLVNINDDSDELEYHACSFLSYIDYHQIIYKSKWLEYVNKM